MRLLLVRHGETEWNKLGRFQGQRDIPLNQRGLDQARETALAVKEHNPAAVYSSPLGRTIQMAQEISGLLEVPVIADEGLKELVLGELEGITGAEMRVRWPQLYEAWRSDPSSVVMPGGESLAQLQMRAWQSVTRIEQAHCEGDVLAVVSHNFTIRTIVAKLLGLPLANFHRMSLSLGSICSVDRDDQGRRLLHYNAVGHLSSPNR